MPTPYVPHDDFTTEKCSAALIIHNKRFVLLQELIHQDQPILDIFGTWVPDADPNTAHQLIMQEQSRHFNTNLPAVAMGKITSYIDKPEQRVKLTTFIFALEITDKNQLPLKDKAYLWFDTTSPDKRIREDLFFIIKEGISGEKLDSILDVDQSGLWIDAKLLSIRQKN